MTIGITNDLIGKKIKLIKMYEDPNPIEENQLGTIVHVGGDVINVKWDNGRYLGVVVNVDEFEILN
jgi:hypothetical protein